MIIVKSPLRISLFGGSTDYESFYSQHGSFIIGTTIDKHVYLSMRYRPKILSQESYIIYSKTDIIKNLEDIQNPLIKKTFEYKKLYDYIEFNTFSDIPSRTGLGGSSSFCVGLLAIINRLREIPLDKKSLAKEAIIIERNLLNESGGIQDQIWAAYGGFNSIEINKSGDFFVKPLPITDEFKQKFEDSMVLIYTNNQREQDSIAKSHEHKDKTNILNVSFEAYNAFAAQNIKEIGNLLFESWKMKRGISNLITTSKIDQIINECMNCGAYGAKLLGSGGCGFVLAICNKKTKNKLQSIFKDSIMNISLEPQGVSEIYPK